MISELKTFYRIYADTRNENTGKIVAKQNDTKTRYLDITVTDNGVPVDLTGCEVRIYGRKKDGTEFYNNGTLQDATTGRCLFEATTQMLAYAGQNVNCEIVVFKDNEQILSTMPFDIFVVESLMGESAIESSNEYGALVVLYQNLYEAIDLMTTMVQNIGSPSTVAEQYNLETMWQAWEFLVAYMKGDFTDKVDEAIANSSVQGVLDLIGNARDSGNTTVFGKENAILENMKNTIPLYRPDDYLVQAVAGKSVLIQNEEKSATYNNDTLVGTVNLPSDCTKIIIKGNFKGNYIQVYLNNAADNETYWRTKYFNNGEETYTAKEFVLEKDTPLPSALKVYLYTGNTGTVYCNNLTIEACTLKRVVTKELYETGTIKSYGAVGSSSDTPYLPQCPRLDRVDYLTSKDSSTSVGTTVKVDNILFVRKIGDYKGYRIRY